MPCFVMPHTYVIFFLSDHVSGPTYNTNTDYFHFLLLLLQREIKESKDTYSMCWRVAEIDGPAGHAVLTNQYTQHTLQHHQLAGKQQLAYRGQAGHRNGRHIALRCMLMLAGIYMHSCMCWSFSLIS